MCIRDRYKYSNIYYVSFGHFQKSSKSHQKENETDIFSQIRVVIYHCNYFIFFLRYRDAIEDILRASKAELELEIKLRHIEEEWTEQVSIQYNYCVSKSVFHSQNRCFKNIFLFRIFRILLKIMSIKYAVNAFLKRAFMCKFHI